MDRDRVASILDEMGTLLELRGENPFRCRAYRNASQAIRATDEPLDELVASGRLGDVPGLGAAMVDKVTRLVTTGGLAEYDDLRRDTPPGLIGLLRVPGLGPTRIKTLRDTLKLEGLADLKKAAEAGAIAGLKGFGAKTQAKILEGIAFVESTGDRILLSTARRLAEPLLAWVRDQPGVTRAEIAGSLRRRKETIGDLDLLFASDDPAPVLEAFAARPEVATVLGLGGTKASVQLSMGVQCDLRGVPAASFACAWNYFTGSKEHNIELRRRAQARGLKLSEYALEGPDGPLPIASEEDLYRALGLHFLPPELRDDPRDLEASAAGPLPRLVERADLRGTFHCHTDWSDGGATLEEMAEAAAARGLKYLGIADHSRSAGYAGGLSIDRVREQWAAIDRLNERLAPDGFRLFKGTECDILGDGTLDFPDEVLAGFDYVVASVHSLFGLDREAMTARIVRAARHPKVTMLGHPTGRLLLARDAYAVDLEAVIEACAEAGTLIEINANPHRLDLDAPHARRARDLGLLIAINPDAHSTGGLDDLVYGVAQARRAGLRADDVLNAKEADEVDSILARLRDR
jgi:DNA polymerase (family 10)